jgi:hypothetical protein
VIDSRGPLTSDCAMADSPRLTRAKQIEQAERAERLARALRENLHRRKSQARAKQVRAEDDPPARSGGEPPA